MRKLHRRILAGLGATDKHLHRPLQRILSHQQRYLRANGVCSLGPKNLSAAISPGGMCNSIPLSNVHLTDTCRLTKQPAHPRTKHEVLHIHHRSVVDPVCSLDRVLPYIWESAGRPPSTSTLRGRASFHRLDQAKGSRSSSWPPAHESTPRASPPHAPAESAPHGLNANSSDDYTSTPTQTIASTTNTLNHVRLHHLGFGRGIWFASFADTICFFSFSASPQHTPGFFRCGESPYAYRLRLLQRTDAKIAMECCQTHPQPANGYGPKLLFEDVNWLITPNERHRSLWAQTAPASPRCSKSSAAWSRSTTARRTHDQAA